MYQFFAGDQVWGRLSGIYREYVKCHPERMKRLRKCKEGCAECEAGAARV